MPPTEKRGRVQTSTITVAVMDEDTKPKFILNRDEVERKYCRSGGKGGQKVNKTESCVILIHKPTGIIVRSEENRTQAKNEDAGWKRLEEKLSEIQNGKDGAEVKEARFNQIGYGNRNDKRRTYREQDGYVLDHITGKRISIKDLYKGKVKDLHKSN